MLAAVFGLGSQQTASASELTATFNIETETWSSGDAASNNCSWSGTVLTVNHGANIKITGAVTGGRRIEVEASAVATITLENVSITGLGQHLSPLLLNDGAILMLTLVGENTLEAGHFSAGVRAPDGTMLRIDGTGSLTATAAGGNSGAGIGGGNNEIGGDITINGGNITATGSGGAGIGGGSSKSGGTTIINGGNITAKSSGAGIGGGADGNGGNITINDGVVNATSTGSGAGIGGGSGASGGNITINGGVVTAAGYKETNAGGAGIGGGGFGLGGGTILISGGTVHAAGGYGAAGIGGGRSTLNAGDGGDITISGGAVTAIGDDGADGIGRGYNSLNAGTLRFPSESNAVVFANSISDTGTSNKTGGALALLGQGTEWHGLNTDLIVRGNITVPDGYTLTVPFLKRLVVWRGFTLDTAADGAIQNNGTIYGNAVGSVSGNAVEYPSNHIDLADNSPHPYGIGWTFASNVYTILDGANVTVTGTSVGRFIAVAASATANINFENVTIGGIGTFTPLLLNNGAVVTLNPF